MLTKLKNATCTCNLRTDFVRWFRRQHMGLLVSEDRWLWENLLLSTKYIHSLKWDWPFGSCKSFSDWPFFWNVLSYTKTAGLSHRLNLRSFWNNILFPANAKEKEVDLMGLIWTDDLRMSWSSTTLPRKICGAAAYLLWLPSCFFRRVRL